MSRYRIGGWNSDHEVAVGWIPEGRSYFGLVLARNGGLIHYATLNWLTDLLEDMAPYAKIPSAEMKKLVSDKMIKETAFCSTEHAEPAA